MLAQQKLHILPCISEPSPRGASSQCLLHFARRAEDAQATMSVSLVLRCLLEIQYLYKELKKARKFHDSHACTHAKGGVGGRGDA
jgi:hypothetical protein